MLSWYVQTVLKKGKGKERKSGGRPLFIPGGHFFFSRLITYITPSLVWIVEEFRGIFPFWDKFSEHYSDTRFMASL